MIICVGKEVVKILSNSIIGDDATSLQGRVATAQCGKKFGVDRGNHLLGIYEYKLRFRA